MADNIQIVKDSIELVFNNGEVDKIPELYTEDFVSHQGGFGLWKWEAGLDGLRRHVLTARKAWPDYHEAVELIFGWEDFVAVRMTISGTNTGEGVFPATHKRFEVKDMMFVRLRDGKLHEQWGLTDNYSRLIQLGLLKPVA